MANSRDEGRKMIEEATGQVASVSCETYMDLRKGGSDVVAIDIRQKDEWELGHLEEAVHIPRGNLEMEVERLVPDKHQPIMLVCQGGGHSVLAAKTLRELGYTDVRVLEGGYRGYCEIDPAMKAGNEKTAL